MEATRAINGVNAQMMSVITGKSPHQDASCKWRTFDLVKWIRARRLQWLGLILRMDPKRQLKQTIFEMFKDRKEGDMLMDEPDTKSWRELTTFACDEEYWKARVRVMWQPRLTVEMGPHTVEGETLSFTISS